MATWTIAARRWLTELAVFVARMVSMKTWFQWMYRVVIVVVSVECVRGLSGSALWRRLARFDRRANEQNEQDGPNHAAAVAFHRFLLSIDCEPRRRETSRSGALQVLTTDLRFSSELFRRP